jgi:hypothetical protein
MPRADHDIAFNCPSRETTTIMGAHVLDCAELASDIEDGNGYAIDLDLRIVSRRNGGSRSDRNPAHG